MGKPRNRRKNEPTRGHHFQPWEEALFFVGSTFFISAIAFFDVDPSSKSWLALKNMVIGASSGLCLTMMVRFLDKIIMNHWPEHEERRTCVDISRGYHLQRIEAALRSPDPAESLMPVYADDDRLATFDSAEVLRAIGKMHEGAFLATVNLWDESTIDESVMLATKKKCTEEVQRKIFMYRELVAQKITGAHIIAARRYRVKHADLLSFLQGENSTHTINHLLSLCELICNVHADINQGWFVDVEFYSSPTRHNPFLDYALLFGAQTDEPDPQTTPRLAYVTHQKDTLLEKRDYVGVVVNDADLAIKLMEDRFRTEPGIMDGESFIAKANECMSEKVRTVARSSLLTPDKRKLELVKQHLAGVDQSESDSLPERAMPTTEDARTRTVEEHES